MVAKSSVLETCDNILQHIRSSHLNFLVQESPFSLFVTIRKSFNQQKLEGKYLDDKNDYNQNLQDQKSKNQILHSKSDMLEHERSELLRDYEEEVSVSEVLTIELKNTKSKLNNLETKFATIKATMNLDRIEKERSCFEQSKSSLQIEALSDTNDELTKEIKALSLYLKNAKKDAKDQFNEKEKIIL